MRVAILQSNYIPWKGYFDIIAQVDQFIFHDDLQYTKGDWRNRNKIKSPSGVTWLTIPCGTDEKRLICDVALVDPCWQKKHWELLYRTYAKAPFFSYYRTFFEEIYLSNEWHNLSDMNQYIIKKISTEILGIDVIFDDSRHYALQHRKGARVIELLQKVGASQYLSGPAAKDYLDPKEFTAANIELEWMSYDNYPEYPQMFPPFCHYVTILDLLFNVGCDFKNYMMLGNKYRLTSSAVRSK